jgi:glutamyl-tRNA synthetase
MSSPARVRIAPSPTGDPHVGTAYTGLFNWLLARQTGGQFVLRIEDTDRKRSTKESEEAILRSLRWLGLDWDEGPDVGGPYGPYRQSERSELYREAVETLIDQEAAYRCYCTAERLAEMREHQRAAKQEFGYDGHCRDLTAEQIETHQKAGDASVVRLKVDKSGSTTFVDQLRGEVSFENKTIDDQVLLKSDGFPTYHLANVVDDHHMKITHVLRAEEWISSTPKHVLLYEAFGWQQPVFCHLPLLRNADKSKISKRKNPTSLDHYHQEGYLPEALLNFLALMGFSPTEGEGEEVLSLAELQEAFSVDRVSLGGPVFDLTKLAWLNGEWIRRLDTTELAERLEAAHPERPWDREFILQAIPLVRERLKRLLDLEQWTDFFFVEDVGLSRESFRRTRMEPTQMVEVLQRSAALLSDCDPIDPDHDEAKLRDLAVELDTKIGNFFMTLRVAVTGKTATPPLMECMAILGTRKSAGRLVAAAEFLSGTQDPEDL